MITASFRHRGLVVASPTYSENVFPPVQSFLKAIEIRGLKNRVTAAMGSFTWVTKAGPAIQSQLEAMGLAPIEPALLMKQGITSGLADSAKELGHKMAAQLMAKI